MSEPATETWSGKRTTIGEGFDVIRGLPHRGRRSVGPWCFLDHFGPTRVDTRGGMQVGAHPHIGLQTVTWLFEGAVLHRDSVGSVQRIVPGQLNLMTAGARGIAHTERTPADAPANLHGVQLWTALPSRTPAIEPFFEHHPALPVREAEGVFVCVFAGELEELRSPATMFTPASGAEIRLAAGARVDFEVPEAHEHVLFVVSGTLEGEGPAPGELLYHPPRTRRITLAARTAARVILLGGTPRTEPLHMWWNFVGADREEIRRAAADWQHAPARFGEVSGDVGDRIAAPPLPAAY